MTDREILNSMNNQMGELIRHVAEVRRSNRTLESELHNLNRKVDERIEFLSSKIDHFVDFVSGEVMRNRTKLEEEGYIRRATDGNLNERMAAIERRLEALEADK